MTSLRYRYALPAALAASMFVIVMPATSHAQVPLREKLGQMVMVTVTGDSAEDRSPSMDTLKADLSRRLVGGLVMFVWSGNLNGPAQIAHLSAGLQQLASPKLLLAIDEEGGLVARLGSSNGFSSTPSAYQMGTVINQESYTRSTAATMAGWFAQTGLNLDLAPVVDVDVNPSSPAIGALDRSFSADPERVALHAGWFIDEFHKKNIMTTLKHYPGHGSATSDSHLGFTDVTTTWSPMELTPYNRLLSQHVVDAIMTAHVFNSTIDSLYPATLSPATINGMLRGQLGYGGVVLSDAMGMKAITDRYGTDQAMELAVKAGVDMLLYTSNLDSAGKSLPAHIVDVLERAVNQGRISAGRIDSSYSRIMALKNRLATGVADLPDGRVPASIALANFPNPFNPVTTVQFDLPGGGELQLEVFNVLGERVAVLSEGVATPGRHLLTFNAAGLPSGVYFCRLRVQEAVRTIRMMLLK